MLPSSSSSSLYLFLLLLLRTSSSPASADRRFGCLFKQDLCTPVELCVNDGMFGRCHSVPVNEVYSYDVTLPVVQHFRLLLDKMAAAGLTWEDDTTQHVLAKGLSKVMRIPHWPPLSASADNTDSRPAAKAMDPVVQGLKPVEAELSRNLHTYLQRLGLLPKVGSAEGLSKSSLVQSDLYSSMSDPTSSKASSSFKVKQNTSADRLQVLLSTLRQLISTQPDTLARLRPVYTHGTEASAPKNVKSRPKTPGASAKEPLTVVDEKFIQNVLKNIGRQHLDVDNLTPHDMDQLSNLIVDALQVVDKDRTADQERIRSGPRDLGGELSDGKEEERKETARDEEKITEDAPILMTSSDPPQEVQSLTNDDKAKDKVGGEDVFSKLLAYLDQRASSSLSSTASPPPPRLRMGLENVRSRTSETGVLVQKKDATQSVEEMSEVEGWVKEVAPQPGVVKYQETRQKMPDELQLDVKAGGKEADNDFGYVITDTDSLQTDQGLHMMEILARMAKIQITDFAELSVVGPAVTFKVSPNRQNVNTADVARVAVAQKSSLEKEAKLSILEAGVADGSEISAIPGKYSQAESTKFLALTVASILCIVGVLLASSVVYCLRHRSHHKLKEKLTNLGADAGQDATATYQELCRQRMAVKPPAERPEPTSSRINSVSSQFSDGGGGASAVSPSARSSLSSWSEEPAQPNMDISTGHMILSYMEDHLKNKNRLDKEWEALCAYQAEPNACMAGLKDGNAKKNRSLAVVAYDHSRITLRLENSQGNSDYINASPIMDHDPRNPAYIATQGPLPSTVADFWQMVWENGCVVIAMLTPLVESGVKQCYHYWPDEGSNLYHIYEVNLVSEHIWCDDFLVRSFYLKNMQTNETRTVTQFHFLTWLNQNVPETSRTLLDFRRKVNKCYRGRSCPIIVHCSDGAGRSGTYILIDMVLNKMTKGAKEIDIAATLEHLRDQRPGMVQTKDQFAFALTTVAEEVNAILKALPQ
ncbi:receptor-type tyrosine-protein phosphatase N2-like isoform X1 [Phyllopteryx taeniolatus]|uniref:receptor-type tyrosine-protein phosphatase N2-like isoform X1 n=2 Tax=Phyllopteryx taeniolatus TaxID=161469 RepID=UPI002AD3FEDB|nr:receptor-type tyrosine-protein phosphatase N2-like isoform X1 [Phyllopteryx taeniolatus]